MLSEDMHELVVEALPANMPAAITVDVSVLADADSVIRASDIVLPSGVTLVSEPDAVVARIVFRRGFEEAAGEQAAGGAASVPAATGEAPAGDAPSGDA